MTQNCRAACRDSRDNESGEKDLADANRHIRLEYIEKHNERAVGLAQYHYGIGSSEIFRSLFPKVNVLFL